MYGALESEVVAILLLLLLLLSSAVDGGCIDGVPCARTSIPKAGVENDTALIHSQLAVERSHNVEPTATGDDMQVHLSFYCPLPMPTQHTCSLIR